MKCPNCTASSISAGLGNVPGVLLTPASGVPFTSRIRPERWRQKDSSLGPGSQGEFVSEEEAIGGAPGDAEGMKVRILLVAAVIAAAFVPGAPVIAAERLHECAEATARCEGEISVPLDWADPSSERITVAFVWLPAKNAVGTVLANPGGPASALPAMPIMEEALGPVLDRHNLLVVEPRGFGASTPLRCPGLDLNVQATIGACAELLGPRARYFTTDQAVADMNAARSACRGRRSRRGSGSLFPACSTGGRSADPQRPRRGTFDLDRARVPLTPQHRRRGALDRERVTTG